uniref:Uncharacterized protein n=1 Tax=Rhizophora mucronata TaxID=61149 RepID=A0A2P2J2E7_RHIMU
MRLMSVEIESWLILIIDGRASTPQFRASLGSICGSI